MISSSDFQEGGAVTLRFSCHFTCGSMERITNKMRAYKISRMIVFDWIDCDNFGWRAIEYLTSSVKEWTHISMISPRRGSKKRALKKWFDVSPHLSVHWISAEYKDLSLYFSDISRDRPDMRRFIQNFADNSERGDFRPHWIYLWKISIDHQQLHWIGKRSNYSNRCHV
jgi:hypothetical protein